MQNANCGISPVKPALYQLAFFKNEVFCTCAFIILLGETLTPSNYQSVFKHYLIEPAFFKLISAPFLIVSKSARKQIEG